MKRLICSTLAVTLACSSFIPVSAFAQNQNQNRPNLSNLNKELAKRLEIQGLRLLIETKMLDEKMPTLMGIPQQIWRADFKAKSLGTTESIVGMGAFTASALSVRIIDGRPYVYDDIGSPGPNSTNGEFATSVGLGILGAILIGLAADTYYSNPSPALKANAKEVIQHDISAGVEEASAKLGSIFMLSPQDQAKLKDLLIVEGQTQLEKNIRLGGDSLKIDSLEIMFQNKMITEPSYKAAKEIRSFIGQIKKQQAPQASLVYGEEQVQNMITYLEDANRKIDDRDVNSHLAALLAQTQQELNFIRSQTH